MNEAEFAGFSEAEWLAAYQQIMPAESARAEVSRLLRAAASARSKDFALTPLTLALLAALGGSTEARVEELLRRAAPELREEFRLMKHKVASRQGGV